MAKYVLEDFTDGRIFDLPSYAVERDEIIAFAQEYDPQPFHLDEAAGKASMLGGLSASGWHVCGMMMRMICDAYLLESTSQGSGGIDYIDWKSPVRPGDTLTGTSTVLASRTSSSKPHLGLVTIRTEIRNQRGETAAACEHLLLCLTRKGYEEGAAA
ncbi:MaoC family dehydratase [Fulvimarina sp. 2208YS6-2-32]|uniref:MaoC family dehydratase n=1 Tax=Fulvimarina uroteuthidis TaxID=3098149 RepID=A0ABU5I494_9HYPH|nr:MaoC family dehydratase [Fulvimarina sp. 2208YS6-2-32]MDY8109629.1 MaoC family dehydratase [Fulvimarina sp. 2208YS6-2-32]